MRPGAPRPLSIPGQALRTSYSSSSAQHPSPLRQPGRLLPQGSLLPPFPTPQLVAHGPLHLVGHTSVPLLDSGHRPTPTHTCTCAHTHTLTALFCTRAYQYVLGVCEIYEHSGKDAAGNEKSW